MTPSPQIDRALRRLEQDGLLERRGAELRTTRSWQSAMARAAMQLYDKGDPGEDLRVPIGVALFEKYGSSVSDDELADLIEAMLPIELTSLGLSGRAP